MTRADEMIACALESLVDDGIFVRTGDLNDHGDPIYKLAPGLERLSAGELEALADCIGEWKA